MRIITPSDAAFDPSGDSGGSSAFEFELTVTGDSSAGFATAITTTAGGSSLAAGFYIIALLADVSGTTIPAASAQLDYFEVQWQENGSPQTTSIALLGLDVDGVNSGGAFSPPVIIDTNSAVEWRYAITGWTSGSCVLKLRLQLTRLC